MSRRRRLPYEVVAQAYTEGIFYPGDTKIDIKRRRELKALGMPEHLYQCDPAFLSFHLKAIKEALKLSIKHAIQAFKADPTLQEYTYTHNSNFGFALEQTVCRDEVMNDTPAPTPAPVASSSSTPPTPPPPVVKKAKEPISLLKAKELFIKEYLKRNAGNGSKLALTCQAHTTFDKMSPSEQQALRYK